MACWTCSHCKTRNCDRDTCKNVNCPSKRAYSRERTMLLLQEAGVTDFDHYLDTLNRVDHDTFEQAHVDTVVAVLKARSK